MEKDNYSIKQKNNDTYQLYQNGKIIFEGQLKDVVIDAKKLKEQDNYQRKQILQTSASTAVPSGFLRRKEKVSGNFPVPSGFWRRLAAFIIDIIILVIVAIIISLFLNDVFVQWGGNLWYVGFVIAGAYFVTRNSIIGKGQTIGKKILKIRVLNENGEYLSLTQSFLRYLILSFIIFVRGITETVYSLLKQNYLLLIISFSIVTLFFAIGITGPIIFTDYKRGLHDYLARSVVIKSIDDEYTRFSGIDTLSSAFSKHKIGFGITLIIFLGLSLSILLIPSQITKISIFKEVDFQAMEALKSDLENNCGVSNVSFSWVIFSSKSEVYDYNYLKIPNLKSPDLEISGYVEYSDIINEEYLAKKMVEIKDRTIAIYHPKTSDRIIVTLRCGYNLGLFGYYNLFDTHEFPLDITKEKNEAMEWCDKGKTFYEQGKYSEAIECYDKALALDPNLASAWSYKGVALANQGKYSEAIECYDKAIAINPNEALAWNNKGLALIGQGKYSEALECIDKAIAINPNYADVWATKGVALANQGKYPEAIICLDKAIAIDPNLAAVWYNKGLVLQVLGRNTEAQECFDKAKQLGYTG